MTSQSHRHVSPAVISSLTIILKQFTTTRAISGLVIATLASARAIIGLVTKQFDSSRGILQPVTKQLDTARGILQLVTKEFVSSRSVAVFVDLGRRIVLKAYAIRVLVLGVKDP